MRWFSMTVPTVASSVLSRRSAAGHLDGFRHRADLKLEVEAGHLLHLQLDAVADHRSESPASPL